MAAALRWWGTVIRLAVRTVIALAANTVGLIVAAVLLDGMSLDVAAFVLPFLGLTKYLDERRD
jgi:hypothetical protein